MHFIGTPFLSFHYGHVGLVVWLGHTSVLRRLALVAGSEGGGNSTKILIPRKIALHDFSAIHFFIACSRRG